MTTATEKTSKQSTARDKAPGLTAEERAAMKERTAELRTEARRKSAADKAEAEAQDCLAKIAELPAGDRELAERFHIVVTTAVPELAPRTWYGMPAYAKDGQLICFFQSAAKFKARYATFGFDAAANLDDGAIWPTSYAVTAIGDAEERLIAELVTRAVS